MAVTPAGKGATKGKGHQSFRMSTKIDEKYVKEKLGSGMKVVNVLSAEDFHKKRIPGSLNIPVDAPEFDKRFQEAVPDKTSPVIIHCAGPTCEASPKAGKRLDAQGYTNVFEFNGGIETWEKAGYRLEGSDARERPPRPEAGTEREHTAKPREVPPV